MAIEIVLIKLMLTFLIAMLFGLQRQRAHKPIGFGTFIFVSISACALAIAAIEIAPTQPLHLLSAIVTGIGFLGAGALIKTTDKIFGFTTAASIWTFAIIGLLIGSGKFVLGLFVYMSIWIVIFIDKILEKSGVGSYQRKITIETASDIPRIKVRGLFPHLQKLKWISSTIDKKNHCAKYVYLIACDKIRLNKSLNNLNKTSWVKGYRIE